MLAEHEVMVKENVKPVNVKEKLTNIFKRKLKLRSDESKLSIPAEH